MSMSKGSLMNLGKKVAALMLVALSANAQDGGTPPKGLSCLARYYRVRPILRSGKWLGVLPDGEAIPWDDGVQKSFDQKLETPDLEDTLSQRYDAGTISPVTTADQDPGRIRVDA